MKKRILSAALTLCMTLSLLCTGAGAAGSNAKLEAVQALGILSAGDSLTGQVTRAQFAQMLVAASVYKDSAEGYGASLFKDLKGDHQASGSVRIAIEQGWMSGYVDGTFRPDQAITLEEGCSALLKVLGYDSSTLKGAYPAAQLAKASSIGLMDGVSAQRGSKLTRQDCVDLFYNLLTVKTSAGAVYGSALGCTISNGQVDYSALVAGGLKGPYTAADGALELPFSLDGQAVLLYNGTPSTQNAVKQYDVYYYNENIRTVWVYNNRVVGALKEISPNQIAPESVTVAGQSYQLENQAVSQKVSGFEEGEVVTLLLGMDGKAADILRGVHGELDDDAYIAVVNSDTEGPYVAASQTLELPFDGSQASVYRNGSPATLSSVQQYDVYYYNTTLQTVWVYNNRVAGALKEISPNQIAPESVTVAGQSYQLENQAVSQKVSEFEEGEVVTLLLGMDGKAADILRGVHGELDNDAYIAVVNSDTEGPYVAASQTLELPFDGSQASVYRNGSPASLSSVQQYDVYYYNTTLQTVWVYNNRVVGALKEISPNQIAPESVTVAGQTYQLENQAVSQKVSEFEEGEVVTLLLGMDGKAADILRGVHGELDNDAYIAVVNSDTEGPYVAASQTLELPFDGSQASVYRNGSPASLSSVQQYDVYYYNTTLQTVWVYSNRVTGTLTAISSNQAAPAAVTVAGVSYQIGTSEASWQFSSQGSFQEGDMVTLLLGMNGEVVRAIDVLEDEAIYYGLVVSSAKAASTASTTSSATVSAQVSTQVACTDGTTRTFYHSGTVLSAGNLVTVSTTQSGTAVKSLPAKRLEGTVSKDGTGIGAYKFAAGVQILDTDNNGGYARVYPSRLAGSKLSGADVRYYTLNAAGEIDRMVLQEVTGDTRPYVYISGIEDNSSGMNISVSYTYIQNGQTQKISGGAKYAVKSGGAMLVYEKGSLKSMRQLASVNLDSLSPLNAMGGGREYKIAENAQVLLRDGSSYYLTDLSQVNAENYQLTGWYDSLGYSAGGRIRIIAAVPK